MLYSSYISGYTERILIKLFLDLCKGIFNEKGKRLNHLKMLSLVFILPLVVVGLLSWLVILFPQILLAMFIGIPFMALIIGVMALRP